MARYRRTRAAIVLVPSRSCGGCGGIASTAAPATPAPTARPTQPPRADGGAGAAAGARPPLGGRAAPRRSPAGTPGTYQPAVDPLTGDIWVALSSEHIIWIFSKDGEYKSSFGKPGDGPGEFELQAPRCRECPGAGALAFAPDGSLFVADVGNHRVQKFDPEHEFETEWGGFGAGEGKFADAIHIATNGREVFVGDDAQAATPGIRHVRDVPARAPSRVACRRSPRPTSRSPASAGVYRYDADGNQLGVRLPAGA